MHQRFQKQLTQSVSIEPFVACQALGIPFKAESISERCEVYREFAVINNSALIGRVHEQMETQLQVTRDKVDQESPSFALTSTPCNPFSVQRAKRYSEGSVASHCDYNTSMDSVVQFYEVFEPKAGVTEQVRGFLTAVSGSDRSTPLSRSGSVENQGQCVFWSTSLNTKA